MRSLDGSPTPASTRRRQQLLHLPDLEGDMQAAVSALRRVTAPGGHVCFFHANSWQRASRSPATRSSTCCRRALRSGSPGSPAGAQPRPRAPVSPPAWPHVAPRRLRPGRDRRRPRRPRRPAAARLPRALLRSGGATGGVGTAMPDAPPEPPAAAEHGAGTRFAGRIGRHAAPMGRARPRQGPRPWSASPSSPATWVPANSARWRCSRRSRRSFPCSTSLTILPGTMRRAYGSTGDGEIDVETRPSVAMVDLGRPGAWRRAPAWR